jgi:hypothetical protein
MIGKKAGEVETFGHEVLPDDGGYCGQDLERGAGTPLTA